MRALRAEQELARFVRRQVEAPLSSAKKEGYFIS